MLILSFIANQNNADSRAKTFVAELRKADYNLITIDDVSNVQGGLTDSLHLHLFTKGQTVAATCSNNGYAFYTCSCNARGIGNRTEKAVNSIAYKDLVIAIAELLNI